MSQRTKLHHHLSLFQTGYTTIQVSFPLYDANAPQQFTSKGYTYKTKLSAGIIVGDLVVVETSNGIRIASVIQVDETPNIDLEAKYPLRWIIQKVDLTAYNELNAKEATFVAALEAAEDAIPDQNKLMLQKAVDDLNSTIQN